MTRPAVVPVIVLIGCAILVVLRSVRPVEVPDPPPPGIRAADIDSRLDPNTADAASLAAIPNLGEKRAADIVSFRDGFIRDHPGRPAFESPRDLLKVKGIGVALMASMSPYLRFPPAR